MESNKKILIGENVFSENWKIALNKINVQYIIFADLTDINKIKTILEITNIDYILPLVYEDYVKLISYDIGKHIKILHPTIEIYELLNNKLLFTTYMINNFPDCIPTTYYLDNKKLNNNDDKIEYPVIYKPMYSINGSNMQIFHSYRQLRHAKKLIIQKYIADQYEYGCNLICINGIIINYKIIRYFYPKYYIKKSSFPRSFETVEHNTATNTNIINIFNPIIAKLNYSGGMCIDFKFNEETCKMNIFEMNPRFGGSAFTLEFISELITINKK